jgi:hypothetical protein
VPRKSGRLGGVAGSVVEYVIGNRIILFRSVTILYIFYFYLIGVEVMPSFTIIAIVVRRA